MRTHPTEREAAEIAKRDYGYVRARTPAGARALFEEEQAGLTKLIGDEFRAEFAYAMNLLETVPFRVARSMPQNPHEYAMIDVWPSDEEFFRVVRFIRSNGKIETFRGWPYIVLDGPEFYYWTMGWPVPLTVLINRKPVGSK